MFKRRIIFAIAAFVVVAGLVGVFSLRQAAQDKSVPQQDDATPVESGHPTEKEHIYTKDFQKKALYRARKSLTELTAPFRRPETLTVKIGKLDDYVIKLDGERPKTNAERLQDTVCQSDVIVLGSIEEKSVHLLDDETFVFTLYKFRVDEILKAPSALKKGDSLEVARPGGLVKLDGQVIRAIDESFAPLRSGKKYLLFLRFLPESGGYVPVAPEADYSVEGDSLNKLNSDESVPVQKFSTQFVSDAVSSAISRTCSGLKRGGTE